MNQEDIMKIVIVSLFLYNYSCYGSSIQKYDILYTYSELMKIDTKYKINSVSTVDISEKDVKKSIKENVKSLKCFFKFIALSYLRITKNLLKLNAQDQIDSTIKHIESLGDHASIMISVIGNLNIEIEYCLWLFYMYITQIRTYYDFFKNQTDHNTSSHIVLNINYINESLRRLIKEKSSICRDNSFNIVSSKSGYRNTLKALGKDDFNYNGTLKLFENYKKQVKNVMQFNETKSDIFTKNKKYTFECFYLNNLALNNTELDNFFYLYDSNIIWGNTRDSLQHAYYNTLNNPGSIHDGMGKFKKYHELTQNMLTIIMLRITWTHLETLKMSLPTETSIFAEFIGNIFTKQKVSQKNSSMVSILKKFIDSIGLDESLLKNIIQCLSKKSWSCVTNNNMGIDIIKKLLNKISIDFPDLDAISKSVYENENNFITNMIPLNNFSKTIDFPLQDDSTTDGKNAIINKNFLRGSLLIAHIKKVFDPIDFNFIRSIFASSEIITGSDINFGNLEQASLLLEKQSSLTTTDNNDSEFSGYETRSSETNNSISKSSECDSDSTEFSDQSIKPIVTTRDYSNQNNESKVVTRDFSDQYYNSPNIAPEEFLEQNNNFRMTTKDFSKQYDNSKTTTRDYVDYYDTSYITAKEFPTQYYKSKVITRDSSFSEPLNIPLYKIKEKQE